ncbi:hypothetical protein [Jiella avicenniae]|uniref:Uncharacterized protein n=1 Tax=Jiella avicenniae TaxID=2907202 RepID=A0A9X1TEF1_9HYPH|nr:hypothetical protein [Jiella avicenniae]MCE7031018.1 hypothetical protein [Jiella avicenniae]
MATTTTPALSDKPAPYFYADVFQTSLQVNVEVDAGTVSFNGTRKGTTKTECRDEMIATLKEAVSRLETMSL